MSLPEIILIVVSASFVVYIFGKMIYDKIKGKPTAECASCKSNMSRMMKKAKKEAEKFNKNRNC